MPADVSARLVHTLNHSLAFCYGDVELFHYDYAPDLPRELSPKPAFHPLRTLGGRVVTNNQPHDHIWHQGLAMTFAELSGDNFWGGPSYTKDRGYQYLDDHGTQLHLDWQAIWQRDGRCGFTHELVWRNRERADWLTETRTVTVTAVAPDAGYWALAFATTLTNVSGRELAFGSPTTKGRPNAGYGSLFWRGPRDFRDGQVRLSTGVAEPDAAMGARAEWLAYTGKHDGCRDVTTMIFADDPTNPRYPTQWFVRNTPYACVSYAFMFDTEYALPDGDSLDLRYTLIIADGDRDDAEIARLIAASR